MVLDRLRRVTRDGRWIPEVDGLRFVAIAGVLLFHMAGELGLRSGRVIPIEPRYDWLFSMIGNGDRGVQLFFVISGFILALPFVRQFLAGGKKVSLRKFYLRRVTRLEPPYLLSLLLIAGMLGVYLHGWQVGFFKHMAVSALYLHGLTYRSESWVSPVAWSLEIEIQFYVLAPLLMQVLRVRPAGLRRGLIVAAMIVFGVVQIMFLRDTVAMWTIAFYAQYFLAGLLLADIFTLEMGRIRGSWWWDVAGVAAAAGMVLIDRDWRAAMVVMPFVLGVLCLAALKSVGLRKFFGHPWIAVGGGMCYSIYLLHFALIAVLFKVTRRAIVFNDFLADYLVQIFVTLVPVVLLCTVFYVLVERPCMDPAWPSKLWMRLMGRPNREVRALDTTGVGE
jgi:peptidoglycan/LPS O-acetylase OafA/YrhL